MLFARSYRVIGLSGGAFFNHETHERHEKRDVVSGWNTRKSVIGLSSYRVIGLRYLSVCASLREMTRQPTTGLTTPDISTCSRLSLVSRSS